MSGSDDVPPPLPPWRDILPYRREESSPPASQNEDTPPPLPPGRSEESPLHSVSALAHVKQREFGFAISPDDLQKAHERILESGSQWKDHKLHKRDSGNFSGDGTLFHSAKSHHVIKVTSKSAPSSCEGQFGTRSNKDEGYPTSIESTPNLSGGGEYSIAEDHFNFKYVLYLVCVHVYMRMCCTCVCTCVCACTYVLCMCVYVYVYVCVYECMCMCKCVYACMNVCLHLNTCGVIIN